ncbi:MAG: hypothetical protein ABIS03_08305 [Gemmatimonadaceae bacterium]
MTRDQFAAAASADRKWIENTAVILGLRLAYTPAESRRMALVHVFNQSVGVGLRRALDFADQTLKEDPHHGTVVLGSDDGGICGVSIDLSRFYSAHAASLSAALELGGARRRGRRVTCTGSAIERAARYGVDIDLLREGQRMSPAARLSQLDENAAFIGSLMPAGSGPRPQGGRLK